MEFETLNKKDLLSSYLKIDYMNIEIDEWVLVDEFTTMLLDLISYHIYGDDNYVDILVKFNKISNPLNINVGDVIACPNIQSFRSNSEWIDLTKLNNLNSGNNNNKKLNNNSVVEFNKLKKNLPTQKTKPSSNFIKKGGNVIF